MSFSATQRRQLKFRVHNPALKAHLAKTKMNGLNNTMLIQEPFNFDRLFDLLQVSRQRYF